MFVEQGVFLVNCTTMRQQSPSVLKPWRPGPLVSVVLLVLVVGLVCYFGQPDQRATEPDGSTRSNPAEATHRTGETREREPPYERSSDRSNPGSRTTAPNSPRNLPRDQRADPSGKSRSAPVTVDNVIVKDRDGRVLLRGTVELQGTLDRIGQGRKLRFAHDGGLFENREGRLPRKPTGYYTEWIHPTSKHDGPGPQRVVTGRNGEVYYTPDHYRTFKPLPRQYAADAPSGARNERGLQNPDKPGEARTEK